MQVLIDATRGCDQWTVLNESESGMRKCRKRYCKKRKSVCEDPQVRRASSEGQMCETGGIFSVFQLKD